MLKLKVVVVLVGLIQVVFGLGNLLLPHQFNTMFGYSPVPPWTDFASRFAGVRYLALAVGMYLVLRDVRKHISWLKVMIFVQAVDCLASLYAVLVEGVPLSVAGVAIILPATWTILLIVFYPRKT